nr:GNAT family N-acetyltransferase [Maliibacterium massiliense]
MGMLRAVWLLGCRDDIAPCLAVRQEVFVEEQGFSAELERDALDARAAHIALYDSGVCVATGRLIPETFGVYKLGRIAVRKSHRGIGVGGMVLRMMMARALDAGAKRLELGSQQQTVGFYAHFGFAPFGAPYEEEGVPHVHMFATPETVRFPRKCMGEH